MSERPICRVPTGKVRLDLRFGPVLAAAWKLVAPNFLPLIGITLIAIILSVVVHAIPHLGWLLGWVVDIANSVAIYAFLGLRAQKMEWRWQTLLKPFIGKPFAFVGATIVLGVIETLAFIFIAAMFLALFSKFFPDLPGLVKSVMAVAPKSAEMNSEYFTKFEQYWPVIGQYWLSATVVSVVVVTVLSYPFFILILVLPILSLTEADFGQAIKASSRVIQAQFGDWLTLISLILLLPLGVLLAPMLAVLGIVLAISAGASMALLALLIPIGIAWIAGGIVVYFWMRAVLVDLVLKAAPPAEGEVVHA